MGIVEGIIIGEPDTSIISNIAEATMRGKKIQVGGVNRRDLYQNFRGCCEKFGV